MDRRAFLRRSAPLAAAAIVAPVGLAAMVEEPKRDSRGRLIVDGKDVVVSKAEFSNGLAVQAASVTIAGCHFEGITNGPAVSFERVP